MTTVVLDSKDQMDAYLLVSFWRFRIGVFRVTVVLKGVVLSKLTHL